MRKAWYVVLSALCIFTLEIGAETIGSRVDHVESIASEWPTIAENQDVKPRPRTVSADYLIRLCKDPCLGGAGCENFEVMWEQYCRSYGSYSSDCQPAAGRYCARRIYTGIEDGGSGQTLRMCQTCFY